MATRKKKVARKSTKARKGAKKKVVPKCKVAKKKGRKTRASIVRPPQ